MQIVSGLGQASAAQHRRAADPVRGPGQGGDRAGRLRAVPGDPPELPRPAGRRALASCSIRSRRRPAPRCCCASRRSSWKANSSRSRAKLQETNAELERKAHQLADQNAEVERKNREIEEARNSLQEKAEQLALTSKYKSEFLANMSHELRSPLNSLLLLAEQLRQNRDQNLTEKQLEMVRVMHSSGTRPAAPDQRHPRPVEDRGRQRHAGNRRCRRRQAWPSDLDKAFRYQAEAKGLAVHASISRPTCRRCCAPTASASSRC